jgi:hypothetical protein
MIATGKSLFDLLGALFWRESIGTEMAGALEEQSLDEGL